MKYRILMRTKRRVDSLHGKVMISNRGPVILEESEDRILIQRLLFAFVYGGSKVDLTKSIQDVIELAEREGKATVFEKFGKDWETKVILETIKEGE